MTSKRPMPKALQDLINQFTKNGGAVFEVGKDGNLTPLGKDGKELNTSHVIHSYVDLDLVKSFQQWLESQNISQMQALSMLAYTLAIEIWHETDNEDQGCYIATDYERFIHQSVHGLWRTYGKATGEVEK